MESEEMIEVIIEMKEGEPLGATPNDKLVITKIQSGTISEGKLRVGDQVKKVNDVECKDANEFFRALCYAAPPARILVVRDEKKAEELEACVRIPEDRAKYIQRREGYVYEMATLASVQNGPRLGLGTMHFQNRVLVSHVDPGSLAEKCLVLGDHLCDVDGIPVTDKDVALKMIRNNIWQKKEVSIVVERPHSIDAKQWMKDALATNSLQTTSTEHAMTADVINTASKLLLSLEQSKAPKKSAMTIPGSTSGKRVQIVEETATHEIGHDHEGKTLVEIEKQRNESLFVGNCFTRFFEDYVIDEMCQKDMDKILNELDRIYTTYKNLDTFYISMGKSRGFWMILTILSSNQFQISKQIFEILSAMMKKITNWKLYSSEFLFTFYSVDVKYYLLKLLHHLELAEEEQISNLMIPIIRYFSVSEVGLHYLVRNGLFMKFHKVLRDRKPNETIEIEVTDILNKIRKDGKWIELMKKRMKKTMILGDDDTYAHLTQYGECCYIATVTEILWNDADLRFIMRRMHDSSDEVMIVFSSVILFLYENEGYTIKTSSVFEFLENLHYSHVPIRHGEGGEPLWLLNHLIGKSQELTDIFKFELTTEHDDDEYFLEVHELFETNSSYEIRGLNFERVGKQLITFFPKNRSLTERKSLSIRIQNQTTSLTLIALATKVASKISGGLSHSSACVKQGTDWYIYSSGKKDKFDFGNEDLKDVRSAIWKLE